MLLTGEALFLCGRDDLSIAEDDGCSIMIESRDAKDVFI